jgi:hypothetical protein
MNVPAGRVDLLRPALQHDRAAQIATGRVKNGHVKAFDPALLLKAPVVLQRVVVDVKGALLTPARNLSPPNVVQGPNSQTVLKRRETAIPLSAGPAFSDRHRFSSCERRFSRGF